MISRNHGFVNLAACTAICVALWVVSSVPFVAAQSSWQAEWEKTLRAAEAEGQFALYGCCYDYDRVLEVFRKRYPKIKATSSLPSPAIRWHRASWPNGAVKNISWTW
jgi:hypothetical protein